MRRYWLIALLLHVALFTGLLVRFDWWKAEIPQAPAAIQATVVDETELPQPKNRAADEEQAKRDQQEHEEERRKQELKLKQREIEKKRQEESAHKKAAQEEKRKKEEQIKREQAQRQKRIELEKEKRRKIEEQKRVEEEQRRKAEEQKRKQEEQRRKAKEEETRRKKIEQEAAERKKAEAEKRRRAVERKRREDALKSQMAAEETFLEGETQRKNQVLIARYQRQIKTKVENKWLEPPAARPGMSCTVRIRLSPGGDVLVVATVKSSGDPIFDRSVEKAVQKASPLPLPPDPTILPGFPELNFNFKK